MVLTNTLAYQVLNKARKVFFMKWADGHGDIRLASRVEGAA
jgi:hypothetical protein